MEREKAEWVNSMGFSVSVGSNRPEVIIIQETF